LGNTLDITISKEEMKKAVDLEHPKLKSLRFLTKKLDIHEIGYRDCYSLAPVATVGGENNLTFESLNLEIIRVVDSEGVERVQKIIPITTDPRFFNEMFEEISILNRFLTRLDIDYDDVSYFLPITKMNGEKANFRTIIKHFRDILEWAVLLDMAWDPQKKPTLLLRDGLLRSMSMKDATMRSLADSFMKAYEKKDTLLIGVAKPAEVLNYYSMSLNLENAFNRKYPCYCELNKDMEEEAYHRASAWVGHRSFGDLYLAKLTENKEGIILPIEIPSWLRDRKKEILEYVAWTSRNSFPTLGYPYPLIKAHENASLTGIEMEYLASHLKTEILGRYPDADKEKILSSIWFKKTLLKGESKNNE
jgi:hypothetical protein